jgi:predicted NUDIX family NTP pyrophosphohydrolase
MQPLISNLELKEILERGLLTGLWSINQFNKTAREPTLPSREFLEEHPQFLDPAFRDMDAYRKSGHRVVL